MQIWIRRSIQVKNGIIEIFWEPYVFPTLNLWFGLDIKVPVYIYFFSNLNQQASLGYYYKFGWEQIPARQIVSFFTRLEMLAD